MNKLLTKIIMVCLLAACLMTGCSKKQAEEWAYIHDPQTTILSLSDDGKAVLHDVKYTYTLADNILTLTDKDGNVSNMRFIPDGDDQYLLYETAVYEYKGEGEPDGLIGYWQQVDGFLSFEFTENGTFREDYYSPGHYFNDEENGIVKLVYNDMYPDTYIYYSIEGNILTVDYPWPVVRTVKE
ncbi:MAG: hypothetical protein K5871_05250 [Lachnospiraceae bacterium]|nr:hypothetical protein [Lachnospiraceae bacterium]